MSAATIASAAPRGAAGGARALFTAGMPRAGRWSGSWLLIQLLDGCCGWQLAGLGREQTEPRRNGVNARTSAAPAIDPEPLTLHPILEIRGTK